MNENRPYGYRSLFWPIVLIGVGAIMLLVNIDIVPEPSFRLLLRLWPLALVVLGLDILIGRRSPIIGALIGLAAIALVVVLLYLAPSLDLEPTLERKQLNFSTPLEDTTSAEVTIELERYATIIHPLIDSDDLFDAVLETFTDVNFNARGDQHKDISLRPSDDGAFDFDWTGTSTRDMTWEIGLSPEVPLDLTVDVGSGSATLDLNDLILSELRVDGGSGSTDLAIPASGTRYPVEVNGGSGSFEIVIEQGAELEGKFDVGSGSFDIIIASGVEMTLSLEGGSGSAFINLPGDVGVQLVVADRGSGSIRVPNGFDLVDDQGDDDRDTGVWESSNYDEADTIVVIRFDPGSGTLTLR